LIEKAFQKEGKKVISVTKPTQLTQLNSDNAVQVIKMHGDISDHESIVISKSDYETYDIKRKWFLKILQAEMISKTFLFMGFSFRDPNLDFVKKEIAKHFAENQRRHFALFKHGNHETGEEKSDFENRKILRELFDKDLSRYGINTILFERHDDISDFLQDVVQSYEKGLNSSDDVKGIYATLSKIELQKTLPANGNEEVGLYAVKAPEDGTYYESIKKTVEPYVKENQKIKKGAKVCFIDANQTSANILSPIDGVIFHSCVNNNTRVLKGQTLFTVILNYVPKSRLMLVHKITTPVTGTFYAGPAPDAPKYVSQGEYVFENTNLALVEHAKMFYKLFTLTSGKIIRECVTNEHNVVEGQTLFLLETEPEKYDPTSPIFDFMDHVTEQQLLKDANSLNNRNSFLSRQAENLSTEEFNRLKFLNILSPTSGRFYRASIEATDEGGDLQSGDTVTKGDKVGYIRTRSKEFAIYSQYDGVIKTHLKLEGEIVKSDEPLVQIVPHYVILSRSSKYRVEISKIAGLFQSQVQEGDKISLGQILAKVDNYHIICRYPGTIVEVNDSNKIAVNDILFKIV
jgi:biotin carboxyl carrier protein